ncbi:MAG: FkbM family methyltransferase [bacterium]|nr:FkbM family methyltransferase [bacterium]
MTTEIKFKDKIYQLDIRDAVDTSVLAEIFKHREYRAVEDVIATASDAIIDVGAHAGFFSLYARALNPTVKIFALEPEPKNFTTLGQHIKNNHLIGIKPLAVALAGVSGDRELLPAPDSHNHRLVLLSPDNIKNKTTLPVQALSFTDFCAQNKIKQVALIKMDIEGGEYEVIDFMTDADFARVACIIMEYHDWADFSHEAIDRKLRINGFGVQIFPSKFDKKMGFLLARNKRSVVSQ